MNAKENYLLSQSLSRAHKRQSGSPRQSCRIAQHSVRDIEDDQSTKLIIDREAGR